MVSLEVTVFVAYVFESQLTRATGGKGYKLLSVGPALSSVEAGRTYSCGPKVFIHRLKPTKIVLLRNSVAR